MRENPWHLRQPTLVHFKWFKNLIELHRLTYEWVSRLHPNPPPCGFFVKKGAIHPETEKAIQILSNVLPNLPEVDLEGVIHDALPDAFLEVFQHAVWRIQADSLETLYQSISPEEVRSLESSLEEIAVRQGATCAQGRWHHLSAEFTQDLPHLFQVMKDSPFSGALHKSPFLWKRISSNKAEGELLFCPHQLGYPEIKAVANALCHLHSQWMLGFLLALNPGVKMTTVIKSPRCNQEWSLIG